MARTPYLLTTTTIPKQEAIDSAPGGKLDEARVQFYAAEIILALVHLHDLGLMYRDLKVRAW